MTDYKKAWKGRRSGQGLPFAQKVSKGREPSGRAMNGIRMFSASLNYILVRETDNKNKPYQSKIISESDKIK